MKKEDSRIQVQEFNYFHAHKDKSLRIVSIIDGLGMVGEVPTTSMIKEEYIILESGKFFFLLDK